jgi:hypothetical protein
MEGMNKEELVKYFQDNLKRGYPVSNIKSALVKQGHTEDKLNEAIDGLFEKHFVNMNLWVIFSFFVLTLFLPLPIILSSLLLSSGVAYVVTLLITGVLGWICYTITRDRAKHDWTLPLIGCIIPLFSLSLIISSITVALKFVEVVLKSFAEGSYLTQFFDPTTMIENVINSRANPLIVGLVFYLAFNVPFIIDLIVRKDWKILLWYLLIPLLFAIVYFGITLPLEMVTIPRFF